MTFINNFNSLEDMNSYYLATFEVNDSIIFLGNSVDTSPTLLQMSQKIIDIVSASQESFYLYPFSKTIFRKNIHPLIVNSSYKAFINALKNNSYIIEHSGFNVVLKKHPLTKEVYNSYIFQINIDTSDLNNYFSKINTKISNLEADIEFYKNYITDLESHCKSLDDKLIDFEQQIYNKSIATWY